MTQLKEAPRGIGLTNFTFSELGGRRLAGTLFALAWLGLTAVMFGCVIGGLYLMSAVGGIVGTFGGIVAIAAGPLILLVGLMIVRALLEALVLLVQIEANTRGTRPG